MTNWSPGDPIETPSQARDAARYFIRNKYKDETEDERFIREFLAKRLREQLSQLYISPEAMQEMQDWSGDDESAAKYFKETGNGQD